ncbi:MAG: hypothetical protein R3E87_23120 [Burkholderiaceae bacterium]
MEQSTRIKCRSVVYRQGFIEVTPNIHEGLVNLEIWGVRAECDLSSIELDGDELTDSDVEANCELELAADEVRQLIKQLQQALARAERCGPTE